jgi:hypothetical protein
VAVPLQAANQFYQPLFSNFPLAILLQQFFSFQPKKTPSKSLASFFSKSFISSGKRGGATVLGEGRDIVTAETCIPASLNVNILGTVAALQLTLTFFCGWGCAEY